MLAEATYAQHHEQIPQATKAASPDQAMRLNHRKRNESVVMGLAYPSSTANNDR